MINQLNYFRVGAKSFMGNDSLLSKKLRDLKDDVMKHKPTFLSRQRSDQTFATQFLFAVDVRVQRWLESCMTSRHRSDVNDNFINFNNLIEQVLYHTFTLKLPASFKSKEESGNTRGGDVHDEGRNVRQKIAQGAQDREDKRDQNKSRNPKFALLPGEGWANIRDKCLDSRPKWDEKRFMCPRWHTKGDCFTDCNNVVSHVPVEEVPEEKQNEYIAWLAKVRAQPVS